MPNASRQAQGFKLLLYVPTALLVRVISYTPFPVSRWISLQSEPFCLFIPGYSLIVPHPRGQSCRKLSSRGSHPVMMQTLLHLLGTTSTTAVRRICILSTSSPPVISSVPLSTCVPELLYHRSIQFRQTPLQQSVLISFYSWRQQKSTTAVHIISYTFVVLSPEKGSTVA